MLGACSSSDDLKDGGATANEGKSYIAVNIKSVGTAGAGTRAEDYTQGVEHTRMVLKTKVPFRQFVSSSSILMVLRIS